MTTYSNEEIVEKFARKIRQAAKQTRLKKSTSAMFIREAFLKKDLLLETLKEIKKDLDGYTYSKTGESLSEDHKRLILKLTGEELGLSKPTDLIYIVKEASNDNAMALLTYISQFINDLEAD